MRHDVTVEGHGFRLRPIGDADAEFVVHLRNNPALNRYLHAGAADTAAQLAWFRTYYARAGDYYFVVERRDNNAAEGLVALYDVDESGASAEWGRWLMRPGSPAAVESAWLVYRAGFETLGLESIYCRTVADNARVVSFHDSCNITARKTLPAHFEIRGEMLDAIEHRVDRDAWGGIAPRLDRLALATAKRIARA